MIGRIRRVIAIAVGLPCLVVTLGRVRVDLSGALSSAAASGRHEGGTPTALLRPHGRR